MKKPKLVIQKIDVVNSPQSFVVEADEELVLILYTDAKANYSGQVKLIGRGAKADIFGIILGTLNNEITINTLQEHQAPDTYSNLLIKCILSERSKFFYEGFIKVAKFAQRTNAYQRNENLMISAEAKAESKPALEILANDVRCTHSATIGKINPDELFYLESRSLEKKVAMKLIIEGFFQKIIDQIPDASFKNQITDKIQSLKV